MFEATKKNQDQTSYGDFHDLALAICMAGDKSFKDLDDVWKLDQEKLVDFGSTARSNGWITMTQYVRYLHWYYTGEDNP